MSERPELWVVRARQVPYLDARDEQKRLEAARSEGAVPDLLLILEHPPVYTKGRRSEPAHLPMGEDWYRMQGIEVAETDRGGQVTYHGPGQLVAYPIIDLASLRDRRTPGREAEEVARVDVVGFVRKLEEVMIASLGSYGIPAQVFPGLTGVWTAGEPPIAPGEVGPQRTPIEPGILPGGSARKIGSIGIHVNKGITTHGLAINVNNDLQPFEWIVPCAIEGVRMTSVGRELGGEQDMGAFASALVGRFAQTFDREAIEVDPSRLAGARA